MWGRAVLWIVGQLVRSPYHPLLCSHNQNISSHHQMSPKEQNFPLTRTSDLVSSLKKSGTVKQCPWMYLSVSKNVAKLRGQWQQAWARMSRCLEGHWLSLLHISCELGQVIVTHRKLLPCMYAGTVALWDAGETSKLSKPMLMVSLFLQPHI